MGKGRAEALTWLRREEVAVLKSLDLERRKDQGEERTCPRFLPGARGSGGEEDRGLCSGRQACN